MNNLPSVIAPESEFHVGSTLQPVNWFAIGLLPAPDAADALKRLLRVYDGALEEAESRLATIKENIFNVRMCCFRIISERELWKLEIDPEYGIPYKSMHRWMQVLYPKEDGLRYAQTANAVQKALPAATVSDLAQMKQCNAVLLADKLVSDTCRHDPKLIAAAKTATEREFRECLNREHGQHLDSVETLKFSYPKADAAIILQALDIVGKLAGLDPDDRNGELLAWAIDYVEEHREEAVA